MPKVPVYNQDGQTVGEIELSDKVFGSEVNEALLHQAVVMHLASLRRGTHDTKTRAEVSGGGKKPWRQKGTGRARAGSNRSPLWRHGGVVFGPHPRSYRFSMPKKARRVALRSALSSKLGEQDLIVLDSLQMAEPKTKAMARILENLKATRSAFLVTAGPDENVMKSARNIAGVKAAPVGNINVYDVLKHKKLVLTKDAVAAVEEVLA